MFYKDTFGSVISLISLTMIRPLCLLQTNKLLFTASRDLALNHVKWFHITSHKEIKRQQPPYEIYFVITMPSSASKELLIKIRDM